MSHSTHRGFSFPPLCRPDTCSPRLPLPLWNKETSRRLKIALRREHTDFARGTAPVPVGKSELLCRYKCQGACTRRGVGEYAQRLHLLALGLATRVWFSCAMWSCVCGNHLHSRVGTGACAGSGNQFGHAWRMSPVIINAIVIRKTGALCPSRTLSKRFLASCKVIQDSPSGCCTEWDLSITASDKSVHPIG